jgi:ribosomal protein S27AE
MTMAIEHKTILCPKCGAPMNHHADKLVYLYEETMHTREAEVLEEFYRCPRCGAGLSRRAGFPSQSQSHL